MEGVVFGEGALYLTTARFVDAAPFLSKYTYMRIYYRSIRHKEADYLSAYDYVWRWDTEWSWCNANLGAQKPLLRAFNRPSLRSTAYWKIMSWNRKHQLTEKLGKLRRIEREEESVIQDVQIPVASARIPGFFSGANRHHADQDLSDQARPGPQISELRAGA